MTYPINADGPGARNTRASQWTSPSERTSVGTLTHPPDIQVLAARVTALEAGLAAMSDGLARAGQAAGIRVPTDPEVAQLRERVCDLGDEMTSLVRTVGKLQAPAPAASFTDPAAARAQARRRRIEASGFQVLRGGAA